MEYLAFFSYQNKIGFQGFFGRSEFAYSNERHIKKHTFSASSDSEAYKIADRKRIELSRLFNNDTFLLEELLSVRKAVRPEIREIAEKIKENHLDIPFKKT